MTDNPAHTDTLSGQLAVEQTRRASGPAKPARAGGCTAESMTLMRHRRRHNRSAWTPKKGHW